jgi:hypothetical protein
MNITQYIAMTAGGPGSGRKPTGFHLAKNIMGWKKTGSQMGSNPGGVYKSPDGTEHYVKFPQQHEDQAAAEKLADDVYKTLGFKAPEHTLVTDDGQRVGLAAPMMEGAKPMSPQEINNHPQVKAGMVADAYLANLDVFGLAHDNILKGKNGEALRIDNGGSLNFRAQGKEKPFPADKVDELESMRKPGTHGNAAYADLHEKDLKYQAKQLVDALPDSKIKGLVQSAGFQGKKAEDYAARLIGRRDFLSKRFGLS